MRRIASTCLLLSLLVWFDDVAGFYVNSSPFLWVSKQGQLHKRHFPSLPLHVQSSSSSTTSYDDKAPSTTRYRRVRQIQKYARLPVWPAWNGVVIWITGKVLGPERAAQLEDVLTGRVCPNFFQEADATSPFIMLVHHCHTFAPVDPLRYFQRLFFPEGFPAHPHRGFVTLTYFLEGGFCHRDSLGIEQVYGQNLQGVSHHSQWLSTGSGLLHEEMFYQNQWWHWQRQELYQLWVNLPSKDKMSKPYLLLLQDDKETPVIRQNGAMCRVLAGRYDEQHQANVPTASDLSVMHVQLEPGTTWTYSVPHSYETLIIYVRKGSLAVKDNNNAGTDSLTQQIPVHHTAFFDRSGNTLQVTAGRERMTDFMLLAGVPIPEPMSAQGSMVMNYPDEINLAYVDYQRGLFGRPWPHSLSHEEWLLHVKQNPSAYRAVNAAAQANGAQTTDSPST